MPKARPTPRRSGALATKSLIPGVLLPAGLVSAGLGVSVLPASFQHMRIKGVVYRPLLDPDANTAVWLVQRKDPGDPPLYLTDLAIHAVRAATGAPRWTPPAPPAPQEQRRC